jgi:hypothetical protein
VIQTIDLGVGDEVVITSDAAEGRLRVAVGSTGELVVITEAEPDRPEVRSADLRMTCSACPAQWEGETIDGESFYARYRWGGLSVEVGGEEIFYARAGDALDGMMSTEQLVRLTGEAVAWR